MNLATLAEWSEPKEVQTKYGPQMLRTARPTEAFSAVWKSQKEAVKALGAGFSKDQRTGDWQLTWWEKIDMTERHAKAEASKQAEANVEIPKPDGREYLPYQKAGIAYALSTWGQGRGCLIGDEMGLGKTIQAIGLINACPEIRKVVVICPNTLKINWRNELKRWLVRPLRVAVQYAGQPFAGDFADIVLVNYDIAARFPHLQATQWDLRICDESHFVKNPKAKRTEAVLSIPAKRKLALTGTPILNRPIELFTTLNDLDPRTWPKLFSYAKRYCGAVNNGFGWDFSGASNLEELQDRLRQTIMVRRLKSQVLTELPAKRRQVIELPVNGADSLIAEENAQWEERQAALEELHARLELAKASDDPAEYAAAVEALRAGQGAAFQDMSRIRHEIGLAKLPHSLEFIRNALESSKCIVFAHHVDVVAQIVAEFPQAAVVTGATRPELRQGEVDRFQADPACNIFVGNLAAAEGLTLTAATHVVFVEGQWVPGKLMQMEDRAHRIGQRESVLVSYLVFEGSLDAHMLQTCVDKMDIADRALDRAHDPIEYAEQPDRPTQALQDIAPLPTRKNEQKPVNPKREALIKLAETLTAETIQAVHRGLQQLAACDQDKARDLNGIGFSKIDVRIGHELANRESLSPLQGALGMVLTRKYRGQLGEGPWSK